MYFIIQKFAKACTYYKSCIIIAMREEFKNCYTYTQFPEN